MDYKRQSSKEKATLYSKYKTRLSQLVNGYTDQWGKYPPDKHVTDYIKWLTYSTLQKEECYMKWDEYFKEAKKTRSAVIFKEMSDALKINDYARIKELHRESKALLKEQIEDGRYELQIPRVLDPYDFLYSQKVSEYKQLLWKIKGLEEESKNIEDDDMRNMFT